MECVIPASDSSNWRTKLARFSTFDPTFLPEYHRAYSLRIARSRPLLWTFEAKNDLLVYPFLLTPVVIDQTDTGYNDISGIYGYTGPMATTSDANFLGKCWQAFDRWAGKNKVIAEFIRFSPEDHTENFAHPDCTISTNRQLAISNLPSSEDALLDLLGAKTRNMLRKAQLNGLSARETKATSELKAFRQLYDATIARNAATAFFRYDNAYYSELCSLQDRELRLFATFSGNDMVAASMVIVNARSALYHLGASLPDFAKLGAGNLCLFEMSVGLMHDGVRFINMTGGRTTSADDPLLKFKRSNATGYAPFLIGRRVVNAEAYQAVRAAWQTATGAEPDQTKIIFWRP